METAGEGGAWGMAVLALYLMKTGGSVSKSAVTLSDFLDNVIFANEEGITITATDNEIKGFDDYMKVFLDSRSLEKSAIDVLKER